MNKRGDILDGILFVITLVILATGFFIFSFIVPEITNGLSNAGLNESSEGLNAIEHLETFGVSGIQKGFFFIYVGLIIGILISSFFIRTHPIFIFLYIILLGIAIILAVYLGNMYETLTSIDIFADRLADQTYINLIMNNLVLITLGVGAFSMIIIFSKYTLLSGNGGNL